MTATRKNPRSRTNGRTRLNNNRTQAARPVDVDHEMLRPLALELRRDGLTYRGIADALNHRFKIDAIVAHGKTAQEAALILSTPTLLTNGFREALANARTIGKDLAHKLVIEALRETRERYSDTAEEVKQIELQRLDAYLQRLSSTKDRDTPRVIDTMLRISERRARLLGLDAPLNVRGEISGTVEHHHSGSVAHVHTWNLKLLSDVELEQLEALAVRANGNAAHSDENVLALPAGDPVVVVPPPESGVSHATQEQRQESSS